MEELDPQEISSHLFQRVVSFRPCLRFSQTIRPAGWFSSLSESSFLPTQNVRYLAAMAARESSHLFQRVVSFRRNTKQSEVPGRGSGFSSLSESSFLPTYHETTNVPLITREVLISFRE